VFDAARDHHHVARPAGPLFVAEPEFHLALEDPGDLFVRMFVRGRVRAGFHGPPHDHLLIAGGDLAADLVGDALLGERGECGVA